MRTSGRKPGGGLGHLGGDRVVADGDHAGLLPAQAGADPEAAGVAGRVGAGCSVWNLAFRRAPGRCRVFSPAFSSRMLASKFFNMLLHYGGGNGLAPSAGLR